MERATPVYLLLKPLGFVFASHSTACRCIHQCFIELMTCLVMGHVKSHPNFREFMYKQNTHCGQLTPYIICCRWCYWFWYCANARGCGVDVPPITEDNVAFLVRENGSNYYITTYLRIIKKKHPFSVAYQS